MSRDASPKGVGSWAAAVPAGTEPVDGRAAERALIDACQRGEREAFDALVERYQRDVYRLCYRYANNHADANDLAQESFLKAWKALPRFRGESAFATWLYRIAVNTCLSFRATRKMVVDELPELVDERPSARRVLEDEDRARQVRAAVAKLPEKQRATLILKIYQDLTHEDVARILGTTVGTVKANLFHAVANLRKLVGSELE